MRRIRLYSISKEMDFMKKLILIMLAFTGLVMLTNARAASSFINATMDGISTADIKVSTLALLLGPLLLCLMVVFSNSDVIKDQPGDD